MEIEAEKTEDFMAVTFEIGDALIGIDASCVEEIVSIPRVTPVRGAGVAVLGIINLRGRILTLIDVSVVLGFNPTEPNEGSRVLVVRARGESLGVLVPLLSDVIEAERRELRIISGEIAGVDTGLFLGMFEKAGRVVALMDPEKALTA